MSVDETTKIDMRTLDDSELDAIAGGDDCERSGLTDVGAELGDLAND